MLLQTSEREREAPDYEELEDTCIFWDNRPVIEPWEGLPKSVQLSAALFREMAGLTEQQEHLPSDIKLLQFVSKDSPKRMVSVPVEFASIEFNNPTVTLKLRAFGEYDCVFKSELVKGFSTYDVDYEIHDKAGERSGAISRPWVTRGGNVGGISDCDLYVVFHV